MSFLRASLKARSTIFNARRYATEAPKKDSKLPLYLGVAGCAGLGAYIYIDRYSSWSTSALKEKDAAAAEKPKEEKSPLDPKEFIDFKLKKVQPYNHNTAIYTFELPSGSASGLPIASCVVVKSSSTSPSPLQTNEGKPVIRPYTPVSPSSQEGELTFLIKRYEEGKMSQHIHGLKVGESLGIKGPISKFPFEVNEFEQVGMIAGGSGITPMHQILISALQNPSNKTKFTLIFANQTPQDVLLKEDFDDLQKKYPETFNVVYTVDKPEKDWKGETGYVNKELVSKYFAPASLNEKVKVFVCGPPGQVAAIAGKKDGMKQGEVGGVLKELGYTDKQVFKF